jgi:hypothetical protein
VRSGISHPGDSTCAGRLVIEVLGIVIALACFGAALGLVALLDRV